MENIDCIKLLTESVSCVSILLTDSVNNICEVSPVERFLSLSVEKQNIIINAALTCFGTNGYKKASMSDIATAAGVSKALIFHYFGTKKALYLYLMELCSNILENEINDKFDNNVTDFFDRIRLLMNIEISVMKEHPPMLSFLNSMYFENDDEVKDDIKAVLTNGKGESLRNRITFEDTDISKFKDGIDPRLVMKIFTWLTDGYLSKMQTNAGIDIDTLCKEINDFNECINLFKENFYKEK